VFGYSNFPDYEPYGYKFFNIKKKIKKEKIGDIRNFTKIKTFIKSVKPEIVFHLAAQPLVRKSYSNPIRNFTD
jgi:CDP-glucose 4,6-dehydratase